MPTIRPAIKQLLFAAFIATLASSYFVRYPFPQWMATGMAFLAAACALLAAWGTGGPLARRLLPRECSRMEFCIFGLALGWGVIIGVLFVLGIFSLWTPTVVRTLILLGAGAGLWDLWIQRRVVAAGLQEIRIPLWIVMGALSLIACAPITYYDSLVYHLALPSAYVRATHWISMPELVYSAFPQNMEMLWTLGLLLLNDTVSNLIGASLAGLLLLSVFSWGRRFLNHRAAISAALLLAVMPAFLLLSSGGYVDAGLALYTFLAVYALTLGWPTQRTSLLALAGILSGLALGIKYTGGLSVIIGGVLIAWRFFQLKHPHQRLPGTLLMFLGCAALVFAPWALKNWHYYGNPVFPFLYQWGDAAKNPWPLEAAAGYFQQLVEYEPRSLWQLPKLLWQVVTQGMDFGGGMDVLGNFGWAPIVALLPAAAWGKSREWPLRVLAIFTLAYFCFWGMSRPVLRFLLPAAPMMALLAGYGWAEGLRAIHSTVFRRTVRLLIGLWVLSGGLIFCHQMDVLQLFHVPLGLETRDEFLQRRLNYYSGARVVNQLLDDSSRVLIVGDQRSYYYERDVTAPTVFTRHPLMRLADEADSVDAFYTTLKTRWNYLLIQEGEMKRLSAQYPRSFEMTEKGQRHYAALMQILQEPVYQDDACRLYAL